MKFLADIAPEGISAWLSCFFWLIGGILVILKIIDHFKPKASLPQPLEVQQAKRLVTYDEHNGLRTEFHDFKKEQATHNETLRREAIEGRRLLHKDIEKVGEKMDDFALDITNAVGELKGELKGLQR